MTKAKTDSSSLASNPVYPIIFAISDVEGMKDYLNSHITKQK